MKQLLVFTFSLFFSLSVLAQPYQDVNELYKKHKYDKVIKLGTEYLQKDTASGLLNMFVGSSYYQKECYREAISYLSKGVTCRNCDSWVMAYSMVDLGRSYFMVGDYSNAKTILRACLKPNATPMEIPTAKKYAYQFLRTFALTENYDSWTVVESEHFRFHIQDTSLLGNIKAYTAEREETYRRIHEYINVDLPKLIDFYLWSSPDSLKAEFGYGSIGTTPKMCLVHSLYNQTHGYEIALTMSKLNADPELNSKFISEGVITYFDQSIRNKMDVAKKNILKRISIIDLWKKPEKYPVIYAYQLGGAFVEFLVKNGTTDQLKQLLKDQSIKNAKTVYPNFDALVAKFEKELYNWRV